MPEEGVASGMQHGRRSNHVTGSTNGAGFHCKRGHAGKPDRTVHPVKPARQICRAVLLPDGLHVRLSDGAGRFRQCDREVQGAECGTGFGFGGLRIQPLCVETDRAQQRRDREIALPDGFRLHQRDQPQLWNPAEQQRGAARSFRDRPGGSRPPRDGQRPAAGPQRRGSASGAEVVAVHRKVR